MDPNTTTKTGFLAKTWELFADEEFDFPHISPRLAFPPVKTVPADSNSYFKAPQEPVAKFNGQANVSRNATDRYQTFKIQGQGLQLVNGSQSKKVAESETLSTRKEPFGKKKPEKRGKQVSFNVKTLQTAENKIASQQSTAPLTFKRKLGKLSSLSEPPVSPLKKKLLNEKPSRIGQRVGITLSAARRKEILSLDKYSILEAAFNVMESRSAKNLHVLSNLAEKTTHRENDGLRSNGILYRGRRTSMNALRPKLAPSERVRLLRKKRAVKIKEVMALVPVMPLVPVPMAPSGINSGEPYRRILPKPSMVPLVDYNGGSNGDGSGHSDLVSDQTISDRLNAVPFIVQSVPSSVMMVGGNGAASDGKRSARKRKNNPSTESRTHQWRLNEAEEAKEKDGERESEDEETDCEVIESSEEEEDEDRELEDDAEEYESFIMRASSRIILRKDDPPVMMMMADEEEEKEDKGQKRKVIVKEEVIDDDEEHPLVMIEEEEEDKEQKRKVMVKEEEEELEEEEDEGWRSSDHESYVEQENGYHGDFDLGLDLERQTRDQPKEASLHPQEPESDLDVRIKEEPEETYVW